MFKWFREIISLLRELKTNIAAFNKESALNAERQARAINDLKLQKREQEHQHNLKENRQLRDGNNSLMKKWMRRWIALPIPAPTVQFDKPHDTGSQPNFKHIESARNFKAGINFPSGAPDLTKTYSPADTPEWKSMQRLEEKTAAGFSTTYP